MPKLTLTQKNQLIDTLIIGLLAYLERRQQIPNLITLGNKQRSDEINKCGLSPIFAIFAPIFDKRIFYEYWNWIETVKRDRGIKKRS